ncbi:MAG: LysR family transcriptional regulator [Candidatus Eisenbacteria sp.]|nr:LysR family transcriptional regulator [Candidatus Eisenbacteria bacterium]
MSEPTHASPGNLPAGMHLQVSLWLEDGEGKVLFGAGRLQILEAIRQHGSLSAAAEALGMSYRGLWARIRHSERRLGFQLVESHVGRGPTSGTSLTPAAEAMMTRYARLQKEVSAGALRAFAEAFPGRGREGPTARSRVHRAGAQRRRVRGSLSPE